MTGWLQGWKLSNASVRWSAQTAGNLVTTSLNQIHSELIVRPETRIVVSDQSDRFAPPVRWNCPPTMPNILNLPINTAMLKRLTSVQSRTFLIEYFTNPPRSSPLGFQLRRETLANPKRKCKKSSAPSIRSSRDTHTESVHLIRLLHGDCVELETEVCAPDYRASLSAHCFSTPR